MKPPKSEPYQRSRHRAALHAWVVAATAVAAVGVPASASSMRRDVADVSATADARSPELSPEAEAERVAQQWLEALFAGDAGSAMSAMVLPRDADNESAVAQELGAMSDWLKQSDAVAEPVARRRAGHWALSAWRIDAPGDAEPSSGLLQPIALYNPAADGLFDAGGDWRVVPAGFEEDAALAPLYNADHAALTQWYAKSLA